MAGPVRASSSFPEAWQSPRKSPALQKDNRVQHRLRHCQHQSKPRQSGLAVGELTIEPDETTKHKSRDIVMGVLDMASTLKVDLARVEFC